MAYSLTVNGTRQLVDVDGDTPLLWVLRDTLHLTGTKFGCGIAMCGACTVHVRGRPVRSCSLPISELTGEVITIESVGGREAEAVQSVWVLHDVPQCGYCQSGQVMAAIALLRTTPRPTDADIDAAMTNICRCATYKRIRAAIHDASIRLGRSE